MIPIDSLFSPVTRVRYAVEEARVGQRTDYDRLVVEIWTDGRISPDDALTQASAILQHHLDVFVGYDKNAVQFEEEETKQDDERTKLKKLLNMSGNEIELSVRAANCLNNANITTVGQLAMKTEAEMLKYRNFGNLDDLRIRAVAGQDVAGRLITGAASSVDKRVKDQPDIELAGQIEMIIPAGQERLPSAALGYAAGGSTQIVLDDPSGRRTAEPFFEILVVPALREPARVRPGQTMVLRFETSPKPLLVQGWRTLLQLFQQRFQV